MQKYFLLLILLFSSASTLAWEYCDRKTGCRYYVTDRWSPQYCKPGNQGFWVASSNIPCNANVRCVNDEDDCYCHIHDKRFPDRCQKRP